MSELNKVENYPGSLCSFLESWIFFIQLVTIMNPLLSSNETDHRGG